MHQALHWVPRTSGHFTSAPSKTAGVIKTMSVRHLRGRPQEVPVITVVADVVAAVVVLAGA